MPCRSRQTRYPESAGSYVKGCAHPANIKPSTASCSTAGNLTFNVELLSFDREIGDYVIVHELLHFFVPNHGKLWKSLRRAYLGDHESLEKRLRVMHLGPQD